MNATYNDLYQLITSYIHKQADLDLISKAYGFASEKHQNQFRKSGEAYIIHPLEVAMILAELHVGPNTIIAGLLHDVVEDTDTSLEMISKEYSADVASIVDGVTKVNKLEFASLEKAQVTNHQKMLLAMAKDIRVIVVKLADRLHNMRTLDAMIPEKQKRISQETLEIYAPLAHRLGIFKIKAELEDRSLRYVDPPMYNRITGLIKHKRQERVEVIDDMIEEIKSYIEPNNLAEFTIKGRIKNIYSIYKKMINQNKDFEDIYDVLAIRIIVDRIEVCYQVLGIIHAHYTPIPKRFKDYIAVPKPNMYQSLHTTVIGSDGQTFEVQIRTTEMDKIAEYGIAAHWAYKENVEYSKEKEQYEIAQKLKWYGELLKFSEEENNNAEEYVETIKSDILDANVYVYTPTGEVIDLPKGATPLDFAYKIHSNVGNRTVGAIVNNRIVPLTYELQTGDIVSIKTNKNSFGPSEDWLKIVKTNHAKHKIKSFLNKQNRDVLYNSGKADLDKEMQFNKIPLDQINDSFVKENFGKNGLTNVSDMIVEIGKGNISCKSVIQKLLGKNFLSTEEVLQKQIDKANRILTTNSETGVVVEGLKNPQLKLGNCCYPIPGDEIVGYITKGNGIVVHTCNCKNIKSLENARLMPLQWATNPNRKYPISIKITATQNASLLGEIMNTISANSMSIASINAVNNLRLETIIKLKILTNNLSDLERLIVNLKKIPAIQNIERE